MKFTNENIIVCLMNDISIYWVHNLENNKEVIHEQDDYYRIFLPSFLLMFSKYWNLVVKYCKILLL